MIRISHKKEEAMSARVKVSEWIDRPVAVVFRFHATEHVRNHPRWDPHIRLKKVTDGPLGLGIVIQRVNTRSGKPVEGTMEVVAFEPGRLMSMVIMDG